MVQQREEKERQRQAEVKSIDMHVFACVRVSPRACVHCAWSHFYLSAGKEKRTASVAVADFEDSGLRCPRGS